MKTLTKTLLAACTLVMASTAMAADGDERSRRQAYNEDISDANRDYKAAVADCRNVEREFRNDCRNDARAARDAAYKDAVEHRRTGAYGADSYTAMPGHTPADRGEAKASNPEIRSLQAKP